MTIQVELSAEAEARLTAEAQAHGQPLNEYATSVLQKMFAPTTPTGRLSHEELHIMLTELAEGSENLPKLPISAFSRESFYEDRP